MIDRYSYLTFELHRKIQEKLAKHYENTAD
jgi:hypothetical protein